MKYPIDITLSEIHCGKCRRVLTLGIGGKDHAHDFLTKLQKDDINLYKPIKTRIRAVAEYDDYENERTFRHVGDGVYEFKRPGLRLYAFYDTLDEIGCLILCTNGGTKNKLKEQNGDISRARQIRQRYFEAKVNLDATFTLHEIEL